MERITTEAASRYPDGYALSPTEPDDFDDVDIRKLLLTLWRGKWILIICLLFGATFGYLATTQQPTEYRASGKVLFESSLANIDAGEQLVDSTVFRQGGLSTQTEILRSTTLMRRVVDELNLDRNPTFNPALRPPPEPTWWEQLALRDLLDQFLIEMELQKPPAPPPADTPETRAAAVLRLERQIVQNVLSGLELRPIPDSLVIEISYVTGDPKLAAAIVNSVSQQYIVDQLEGKLETFDSATQWLTERVQELQARVENAEAAVLQAQADVAERAGASLDATRQQLEALNEARAEARQQASLLRARFTRLRDALSREGDIANLPELRDNAAVIALRARREELRLEDERLSATLRPNHPSRQSIAENQAALVDTLQLEATRALEVLRLELETAEAREEQLATDMRTLEDQVLQLSTDSVEVRNLEREAQASRILYENLLTRLEESNAQEELQTADARILTPAEPPLQPLATRQQRTLVIFLVAGGVFGVGIIFLLDRLNNTFRSAGQLEKMLGHPVLATVPAAGRVMKRRDVIQVLRDKPNSSLAESIRNLRTSILFSNVDKPPKVVMFSSSVPREGKSTTSMMTALTSRQMGRSAIIVDCDLRMPALSKVLDAGQDTPGLLSVINNTATVDEAIYKEPETGLHVLMTRSSERTAKINAADVLASDRFKNLVKDLSEKYDLVVLDTPPTLVVTDARIVAGLADAVVFAVRWDKTPRDAVKEGVKELTSLRAPLIGVVMTMVNEQRASKYAYDGYSYYKGRYRDYYEA